MNPRLNIEILNWIEEKETKERNEKKVPTEVKIRE